ncbi:Vacuolar protein sorting-associated protein 16 [Malassezia psittaci]|uniref:Probable vacuolar protein sorting-associated protein 16 homolog n=1 Tax=Malassezia psittaci TaxID=1821823 RepID=A0AAF0JKG3_9BASI|nr:Vacuolar protein sorting-associated protein 16 [Malassezia psittaci]
MPDEWQPAAEWHALGYAFYRRTIEYEMVWPMQKLDEYWLASSQDGGMIALLRDPTQFVAVGEMGSIERRIKIYTGAGQLLETIPVCHDLTQWDNANVIRLGFTWRDELVVVTDEGQVKLFAILNPNQKASGWMNATPSTSYINLNLGQSAAEIGVASAEVLPHCVYAMLRDGSIAQLFFAGVDENFQTDSIWLSATETIAPKQFDAIPGDPTSITAWGVCAASKTVLVSTHANLYTLKDGSYKSMAIDGPLDVICPSPNGKLLALIFDKKLRVMTVDALRELRSWSIADSDQYHTCEPIKPVLPPLIRPNFHTRISGKGGIGGTGIARIAWCGDDTVVLAWRDSISIVGPVDEPLSLEVPGMTHIFGHTHGLQMVHTEAHEFLNRVEAESEAVLRPGSTDVAAILLEASQLAQSNDPRAYEMIQALRINLQTAIQVCISAASQAWDVHTQQRLLKAALFGKTFLDEYDTSSYLEVARTLRVLNAVRDYRVGIPAHYSDMTPDGVSRLLYELCMRHMHHTAARICEYLSIRPDNVLKHWARAKIIFAKNNSAQLAEQIIARFEKAQALDFAEIALIAWQSGHPKLATLLLDHETRAVEQVPLLLHMQENTLALQRAVESGDSDLIYYTMFQLQQRMSRGDFFRVLQTRFEAPAIDIPSRTVGLRPACDAVYQNLATTLLERYAQEQDQELLHDLYFLDDNSSAQALLCVKQAPMDPSRYADRVDSLRKAAQFFGNDREHTQDAKLSMEAVSLLGFQAGLDTELANMNIRIPCKTLVGLPLVRTIEICIQHGLNRRADRLKNEHKVPERLFFATKVHAYISVQDWANLANCVGKRPPGGFTPIVSALINANYLQEACRYARMAAADRNGRASLQALIERCPVGEQKVALQSTLSST